MINKRHLNSFQFRKQTIIRSLCKDLKTQTAEDTADVLFHQVRLTFENKCLQQTNVLMYYIAVERFTEGIYSVYCRVLYAVYYTVYQPCIIQP
jgi:hypothetical protein